MKRKQTPNAARPVAGVALAAVLVASGPVAAAPAPEPPVDEATAGEPAAQPPEGPASPDDATATEESAEPTAADEPDPPVEPDAPAPKEPPPVESSPPANSQTTAAGGDFDATPADAKAAESEKKEEEDSGARFRPPKEKGLLGEHEVDLGNQRYKPGTGLTFTSKNGRFELATRLRAQFLYTLEHDGAESTTLHGLQIRRARLQFKGHFWNKHNKFKTEFAFSPRDQAFDGSPNRTPILDWYLDFTYLRDLSLRIGQYKLPFSRQRVVSSGDLQLVDRSIANSEFNVDRDIGVEFFSKDFLGVEKLKYHAGLYFGEGRDQYELSNFDMLYIGRIEVLPFGMFKDYKEADFKRTTKPRMSIGLSYAFHDDALNNRGVRGSVPSDEGTTDYHNANGDVMFKIAGFSLFSDFFYRHGRRSFGSGVVVDEDTGVESPAEREDPRNGIGWSAQAGYMIPRIPFEIAGRYGQVRGVNGPTSLKDKDSVGGGVSYYIAGHPMKLQADYFHQWDAAVQDGLDMVRVQLQASF